MASRNNIVYLTGDTSPESNVLYGYTFMFDPFILAVCRRMPEMAPISTFSKWDKVDLAISPLPHYSLSPGDNRSLFKGLGALLGAGGSAAIVQPKENLYRHMHQFGKTKYLYDIISLCETWKFRTRLCSSQQDYPYREIFQAVDACGEILSTVGDWPALVLNKQVAFFTVNHFNAFFPWRLKDNIPQHADLWVELVCRLLQVPAPERACADSNMDLRRDFHSFGFALVLLRELALLRKANISSEIKEAEKIILEAANLFVRGKHSLSAERLGIAFHLLYKTRIKLANMDIYLADSAHASTLHPEIGFAEMQWPQWVKAYMDYYLSLAEKKGLAFCLDWDAVSVENIMKRFPKLSARIRSNVDRGSLEFINGGYVQQYPHLWSIQSTLKNFKFGREIFQSATGRPVRTFGGQECCVNPQMPNLLLKSGHTQAVHRIQNFGHVPLVKEPAIMWLGKDGTSIPALPGNPDAAERLGNKFYRNLALKIHQSAENRVESRVFVNMQDMSYRAFLEEVCRIAYYAPVLGNFTTISEYFKKCTRKNLPRKFFNIKDYLYGYFYRNHAWRGNENSFSVRAFLLENMLTGGQFINSLASFEGVSELKNWDRHWKKILDLQSHDVLIAGNMSVGAFGHQKTSRTGGPIDPLLTNAVKAREGYTEVLNDAKKTAARDLQRLHNSGNETVYINTLGFSRKIHGVRFNGSVGSITLPPYGRSGFIEPEEGHVKASENIIENSFIAAHIDGKKGCISSIVDKTTNRKSISECNEFVYGEDSKMIMEKARVTSSSSHRASLRIKGGIYSKGRPLGLYDTEISLRQGSRVVDIKSRLSPSIEIPPNPCDHSFRLRTRLPVDFEVRRALFNMNEKLAEGKIYEQVEEFSPPMSYIFLRPGDPRLKMFNSPFYARLLPKTGKSVDLMNRGTQWYYRKGKCIYKHLAGHNEELRNFHYAFSVNSGIHPLLASLDWQTPVHAVDSSSGAPWSLFQSNRTNTLLFGAEYTGGDIFILRVTELEGRRTRAVISCGYDLVRVYHSDYNGKFIRELKTDGRQFTVLMPAWGISEYKVELRLT